MTLRNKIESHLDRVLDFRINSVLQPVMSSAGAMPVAGLALLTAAASMTASAQVNEYPTMHQHGGKIPSVYSTSTSLPSSSNSTNQVNKPNKIPSMSKKSDESGLVGHKKPISEYQLKRLQAKGLEVLTSACATATYQMFAGGQNASKFSTKEKIIAINFMQPLLAKNNESLLERYASAIAAAENDYTYNWDNAQRAAKGYGKAFSTDQYEKSTENSIGRAANIGAKGIFDAIGFHDTSDKIQKKIERIEDRQQRALQRQQNEKVRELDRKVSSILSSVEQQLKSGSVKMDFTTAESQQVNNAFYLEIVRLLNPTAESVNAAQTACSSQHMTI